MGKKEEMNEIEEMVEEIVDENAKEYERKVKELEQKLIENQKEIEEKLMRNQADLQNYKRRREEEINHVLKYANENLIKDLLPVLDNFERALNVESSDKIIDGIKMVYTDLSRILKGYGLEEIEALDKMLDPNLHHAIMTDNNLEKENDIITEVLNKGYILKDKVIRVSMVKVNQKIEENKEKENDNNE